MSPPSVPQAASNFISFVNASPTPFHVVQTASKLLSQAGFAKLSERDDFVAKHKAGKLIRGGKYFYTRNQSSIVAFTVPRHPTRNTGVSIVGGHTDSPVLKLRPISKKQKGGYLLTAVELYGGGIWPSWFDRDLSIAGRVIVSKKGDAGFVSKLIKIDRPLLRIPTLAIHLDRTINEAFKFNKETEFNPILGLVEKSLNTPATNDAPAEATTAAAAPENQQPAFTSESMSERHHSVLLDVIAAELDCDVQDIHDFELSLYDTQPATVLGINNEFISSPRLDNQMTCYCAISAICNSGGSNRLLDEHDSEENIRLVVLFDNEEIGSLSHHGADSDLLPSFIERIAVVPDLIPADHAQILLNSFLISSDMGHALNPNYESRYEDNHKPRINGGIVIKTNANQRYTSTAATTFLLRRIAHQAGVPTQEFEIRNDSSCGSTIGPMLSAKGLRTVDIGVAQLSMHSIRETCGSKDPEYLIKLFEAYFDGFGKLDRQLQVD